MDTQKSNDKNETIDLQDDWLAQELKREERIKMGDLVDRPKKVKKPNDMSDPFFVIDLILFSLLLPFAIMIRDHSLLPVFILFCFVAPGTILWEAIAKRFPPRWFFILALLLSLVLETRELLTVL